MYEPLLQRLSDRYRLIAPDLPGFGHSAAPNPEQFRYTFDNLAEVIVACIKQLKIQRFTLIVQGYGGPIGFRVAQALPERVAGLIVQNAVAHEEGLGPLWETRCAFWRDRAAQSCKFVERIAAHFQGKGSAWTRRHSPVAVLCAKTVRTRDWKVAERIENRLTLFLMSKHGWQKVRGGFWSNVCERSISGGLVHHPKAYILKYSP
ncbi:alpha/beta hydrolase [Xanthomonas euvesicatoria]